MDQYKAITIWGAADCGPTEESSPLECWTSSLDYKLYDTYCVNSETNDSEKALFQFERKSVITLMESDAIKGKVDIDFPDDSLIRCYHKYNRTENSSKGGPDQTLVFDVPSRFKWAYNETSEQIEKLAIVKAEEKHENLQEIK